WVIFQLIRSKDVVLASGKFPLWLVAFSSLFFNKKFIAVIHGSEVNFQTAMLRRSINWSLKRFSNVIAVSNFTKGLVDHLNLKSVEVIPNGFNTSDWSKGTNHKRNLEGHPKLITVGNVTQRKGQLNVIRQLPEVLKIYPELHYHMVGLPTEKDEFLKHAQYLKVEDHISFHGRVKHEDLRDFLTASDIFVMLSSPTSSGDVEGFGIAVLEANYLGLPAIGALGCGIEDAIDDYSSGILIEHDDTGQFLNAINAIIGNKTKFSNNAIDWAERHGWGKIIKKYIDVIETE
ncbi:MAG: glycosyltransferase family 4 protein, partial [Bacteroidia bacterium]|nr:glycosyltransferase family 4 protein [Bacteroidia bacterium]